ncbi:MAG: hypothetical protein KDA93_27250 [Planctomycetaceae bacterium]|nr:hypothetical protein [Planctomycetaceae bacterium]
MRYPMWRLLALDGRSLTNATATGRLLRPLCVITSTAEFAISRRFEPGIRMLSY